MDKKLRGQLWAGENSQYQHLGAIGRGKQFFFGWTHVHSVHFDKAEKGKPHEKTPRSIV